MLEKRLLKKAKCIFVSVSEEPKFLGNTRKFISRLNEEEFLKEVVVYAGMQEEILEDEELINIFLSILKNDFTINRNNKFLQL